MGSFASPGGSAVLAAAHAITEATAVTTIGAPADPAHVRQLLGPAVEEIQRRGEARLTLENRTFTIKSSFWTISTRRKYCCK